VSRFISFLDQGPEKAVEHMKECFRWRKSFGVATFDRTTIPIEVYQMCPVFIYEPDSRGRLTLYVRVKMHRKIETIEERFKKSFVNYVEQIDEIADKQFGWNIVFDCQNSGYSNADIDMVLFIMPTIRRFFPNAVRYVYVCGLPWILNSVAKIALAFMPSDTAKKIRFITQPELHKRIPLENLPDFLGGICTRNYRLIPKGAKSCEQLGKEIFGLTETEVKKMMAPSMKYITEGKAIAIYEP
jgi:hypothetical protein